MTPSRSETTQELLDRRAIRDCIYRYARGLDRHDDDLLTTAFHPDGIDNHGYWVGRRPEFVQWANHEVHDPYLQHNHHMTGHWAEIEGDTAHSETYVIFVLRHSDRKTVRIGFGRYIDRLERRDGDWRIALRRLVLDGRMVADGSVFSNDDMYFHGTWDRSDLSYTRPEGVPQSLKDRVAAMAPAPAPANGGQAQ